MTFKPNGAFKRDYDRLFKFDPMAANFYLLLCEMANEKGQVEIDPDELPDLMAARFTDVEEYQL